MAQSGRRTGARLGVRVRVAFFRLDAQPAAVPAAVARITAGALLACAGSFTRHAARSPAPLGLRQLSARICPSQGGSVHDGAWAGAARAVARSPVRGSGAGASRANALHDAAKTVSRYAGARA